MRAGVNKRLSEGARIFGISGSASASKRNKMRRPLGRPEDEAEAENRIEEVNRSSKDKR